MLGFGDSSPPSNLPVLCLLPHTVSGSRLLNPTTTGKMHQTNILIPSTWNFLKSKPLSWSLHSKTHGSYGFGDGEYFEDGELWERTMPLGELPFGSKPRLAACGTPPAWEFSVASSMLSAITARCSIPASASVASLAFSWTRPPAYLLSAMQVMRSFLRQMHREPMSNTIFNHALPLALLGSIHQHPRTNLQE